MDLPEIQTRLEKFKDPRFEFRAKDHTYWYHHPDFDEQLTSSTTFTKRFHEPFDPKGFILFACAKKKGVPPSVLRKEWNENGRAKAQIGTDCHETIHQFNESGTIIEYGEAYPIHRARMKAFNSLYERELERLTPICSELLLFSLDTKTGGTLDRGYYIDGKFSVYDWKTNEKMKSHGGFLKYPFTDLKDTDVNRYSIQLSLYSVKLQLVGIPTGQPFLGWLGAPDGELIPCLDLTERLRNYLNV